jgi:hypothetical protein
MMTMNREEDLYGFMQPKKSVTIKFMNGITVTAPRGTTIKVTPVENSDHKMEIKTGGIATVTQADGKTSEIPKGTILDGKGNIVK